MDDGYWQRFTLLGQSLGSIRLVWEGLTGPDGFWGDIFVGESHPMIHSREIAELTTDTMGYAFTFPFVRLIAGDEITIGTYTHYPTVSADMVARVKARSYGVENAGVSSSWLRTQIKLMYAHCVHSAKAELTAVTTASSRRSTPSRFSSPNTA